MFAPSPRNAAGQAAADATSAEVLHASPLSELKLLLGRSNVPEEGLDRFLEIVKQAVDDLGPGDSELIRLVLPYCKYITGNDKLGVLRRKLEQIRTRDEEPEELLDEVSEEM